LDHPVVKKVNYLMKRTLRYILVISIIFQIAIGCTDNKNEEKTVEQLIDTISNRFVPDKRTALFEITVSSLSGKFILKGITDQPEAKKALLDSLAARSIPVVDSISLLPEAALGEKIWGLATLSVSNLRADPNHAAEMVSQTLMGTPLKVLQHKDGWYRIQTPDYYIGWMNDSGLSLLTEKELSDWKESSRYFFNKMNGWAYSSPSAESPSMSDLVLGDLFETIAESGNFFIAKFPDGRTAYLLKNDCTPYQEWVSGTPDITSAIATAQKLLGLPYFWGGTSTKAVDCSGLTKTAWFSQGIILARDASQQARYGEHPDFTDRKNLEPGDLLFFGKSLKKVTHVGLCLGSDLYIHASGLVRINSLDPNAPNYLPGTLERLVATSRIIHSLDTEGIIRIGSHPWYN
jgi:hypothetical protein